MANSSRASRRRRPLESSTPGRIEVDGKCCSGPSLSWSLLPFLPASGSLSFSSSHPFLRPSSPGRTLSLWSMHRLLNAATSQRGLDGKLNDRRPLG